MLVTPYCSRAEGRRPLNFYKERCRDIALVVLDMIMPEMDGSDVYHALKKIKPDVRGVLSSGYSINRQAGKLVAEGIQGFVQRPFSVVAFCNTIRSVIDR
jgi:two-component system, cell cycle sensor histidine kinase and response regulator CckA